MKHTFYQKSKRQQNRIQLVTGLSTLAINSCVLFLSILSGLYILTALSIGVALSVVAPFFDTPSLREQGRLIYYSPLLLAEKEENGIVTIHGGTLFDYVYAIDMHLTGKQRTKFIIQSYVDGILTLINHYEVQGPASIKVKGTSFIMNERTAQKLGFKVIKTGFAQKAVLFYNYFNLTIANSVAKAKLSFPSLRGIKTFEADVTTLIDRKKYIIELHKKLKN